MNGVVISTTHICDDDCRPHSCPALRAEAAARAREKVPGSRMHPKVRAAMERKQIKAVMEAQFRLKQRLEKIRWDYTELYPQLAAFDAEQVFAEERPDLAARDDAERLSGKRKSDVRHHIVDALRRDEAKAPALVSPLALDAAPAAENGNRARESEQT